MIYKILILGKGGNKMIEIFVEDICCMMDVQYIKRNKLNSLIIENKNHNLNEIKSVIMPCLKEKQLTIFDLDTKGSA